MLLGTELLTLHSIYFVQLYLKKDHVFRKLTKESKMAKGVRKTFTNYYEN